MSNLVLTTCLKHFEKLQSDFPYFQKKIGEPIKIGVRTLGNDRKEIIDGIIVKIVDGSKITVRRQSVEYLFSCQNKNLIYHK